MPNLFPLAAFLLILAAPCIGSFLGVVIERLPAGRPILVGRSACPHCGMTLARQLPKFCPACGKNPSESPVKATTAKAAAKGAACSSCRTPLSASAKFCTKCGAPTAP